MKESKAKNNQNQKNPGKDYRRLCNSCSENIFKTVIQKINKLEFTAHIKINRQKYNLGFKVKFHKTINFPSKYSSHIHTSSIININGLSKARDLCFGGATL